MIKNNMFKLLSAFKSDVLPKVKKNITPSRIIRLSLFLLFFISGLIYSVENIMFVFLVSLMLTAAAIMVLWLDRIVLWEEWL